MTEAFHALVSGRVQGVGFRYSAVRQARSLGLQGWVRNDESGGVQVVAEGERDRLETFLSWLRKGPPGAYVRDVQVTWEPPSGSHQGFDVTF